jgi:hypothetical protein
MPAYPSRSRAHLADPGLDPGRAAAARTALGDPPAGAVEPARLGRLVREDRGHALVETGTPPVHAVRTLEAITGDRVPFDELDQLGTVRPRRTTLGRGAPAQPQPSASVPLTSASVSPEPTCSG